MILTENTFDDTFIQQQPSYVDASTNTDYASQLEGFNWHINKSEYAFHIVMPFAAPAIGAIAGAIAGSIVGRYISKSGSTEETCSGAVAIVGLGMGLAVTCGILYFTSSEGGLFKDDLFNYYGNKRFKSLEAAE